MAVSGAWNPRYVAYAAAHGVDPAAMCERDQEAYPAAAGLGFMLWITARWSEWDQANSRVPGRSHSKADQDDFTTWLLTLPRQAA